MLDSFCCTAHDLTDPSLKGWAMRLRIEGDSDDPNTWHSIDHIARHGFRADTTQPFVKAITVAFRDGTPDVVLNDADPVEFAIIRPTGP